MKNSSYKERPSRGVDPVGLVLSSHPQDAQQPGMHSESQPCPLFYSKTGTGRTGLFLWGAGWLCDWSYLQHGNFMLGNLSFLQSPHGRNLKSHNQKKSRAMLLFAFPCVQTGNQGHGCSVHQVISIHFPSERNGSCRCSQPSPGMEEPV